MPYEQYDRHVPHINSIKVVDQTSRDMRCVCPRQTVVELAVKTVICEGQNCEATADKIQVCVAKTAVA